MGRKKIEIRPLADERNRNVTFLKRKAGLMKKAWELSVLCAADVSILIFSATGKPFEFSSRDLDSEIDRYLEYEGAIERRRGEEFAAAAAAGEDDSDDDEETSRRGSTANKPGQKSGVVKSLKGKETFKKKMSNRAELARAVERNGGGAKRGFIEGILSDGSEDQTPESADEDRGAAQQYSPRRGEPSDLASLQYALNMHSNSSGLPDASSSSHGHAPPELIIPGTSGHYSSSLASNAWNYRMFKPAPESHSHSHSSPSHLTPSYAGPSNYPPHVPPMGTVLAHPSHSTPAFQQPQLPQPTPQQQWDPNLLARYAEFQLQQNHQRQQRALLEMQRQQLAELGVPLDDKSLLDDIFGVNAGPSTQGRSMSDGALAGLGPAGGLGADLGMSPSGGDFIWPTVSSKPRSGGGGGRDDEHGGAWGYGLGDEGPFPSPHSTEEARDKRGRDGGHGIPEKRIRVS